jgi:hypothetical protein
MQRPVFFCFESDDKHFPMRIDCVEKISTEKQAPPPTVDRFAKFIHKTFKIQVPLSFTFTVAVDNAVSNQTFKEDSAQPIPVDNLENIVVVRRLQQDIHPIIENFKGIL